MIDVTLNPNSGHILKSQEQIVHLHNGTKLVCTRCRLVSIHFLISYFGRGPELVKVSCYLYFFFVGRPRGLVKNQFPEIR